MEASNPADRKTNNPRAANLTVALKDASIAALIMLGLAVPIFAMHTEQGPGYTLIVLTRWWLVAAACSLVFAVRLLMRLSSLPLQRAWEKVRNSRVNVAPRQGALPSNLLGVIQGPVLVGTALAFPLIAYLMKGGFGQSRYLVDLAILILTYIMLGWGLNVVVGLAGLLDLGYVAFYAIGAYTYALLSTSFGWSFWLCLPIAGILASFWGILLGFPVLRLRGDYLAIVTLAFGEIIRLVLINWVDLTEGSAGISSIPPVTFFGIPFTAGADGFAARFGLQFNPMHRLIFLYYLILVLALVTNVVTRRLRRLPVGRAWEALREDEIACRSLGIDTTMTKLTAFATGAMFGGFGGAFFAVRQGFVSPESFNFLESATILSIVVLGGMGSQTGIVVASILIVGAPEMLRNLGFLKQIFGEGFDPNEYRLLLFGLAMVLTMVWRPRGLISAREPTILFKQQSASSIALVGEGNR
jgi:branched-chain amino acid transport system permease protein